MSRSAEPGSGTESLSVPTHCRLSDENSRGKDLVALVGDDQNIRSELETWCRFTANPLLEATLENGRVRFVFRCGAVALPAETSRPVGARLWLYANFDCNLRCDYCSVRSSPAAPRRELGLGRVQRIAREAAELGVKEIFVTGGEPFLLDDIGEILRTCAVAAPTTVLTNGMLFAGRRLRPTELYPAIASFYKSAWIARRQTATTCIAGPEPGSEHTKASNALVEKDFECGWRQRFRAMPRLRSSVTSVRSANMPRVSPPGAAAIFHVGDGVSPRS